MSVYGYTYYKLTVKDGSFGGKKIFYKADLDELPALISVEDIISLAIKENILTISEAKNTEVDRITQAQYIKGVGKVTGVYSII